MLVDFFVVIVLGVHWTSVASSCALPARFTQLHLSPTASGLSAHAAALLLILSLRVELNTACREAIFAWIPLLCPASPPTAAWPLESQLREDCVTTATRGRSSLAVAVTCHTTSTVFYYRIVFGKYRASVQTQPPALEFPPILGRGGVFDTLRRPAKGVIYVFYVALVLVALSGVSPASGRLERDGYRDNRMTTPCSSLRYTHACLSCVSTHHQLKPN